MGVSAGFIEIRGLANAVRAADAALKAADVRLVEIENSKGGGNMTVKLSGDVSAVEAAVEAAVKIFRDGGAVKAHRVIANLGDGVEIFLPQKNPEEKPDVVLCNLCRDIACPRKPGESHKKCIHFNSFQKTKTGGKE